jgi:hypothetical protein
MVFHKDIASPSGGIHGVVAYEYPNASGRLAATGFASTDQFKIAHQADTDGFWMLGKISPVEWNQVLVGTGILSVHHTTHEASGSDQINVSGLAGRLADAQNADALLGITVSGVPTATGMFLAYNGSNWYPALPGTPAAGTDGSVQFNQSGTMSADEFLIWDAANRALAIGQPVIAGSGHNPLAVAGNLDDWIEFNIQNKSSGQYSTADIVATADNGDENSNYLDMGIDGGGYYDPAYPLTGADDAYIFANGGHLVIGAESSGKIVKFFTGSGWALANLRASIDDSGMNLASGMSYRINNAWPSVSGWPGQLLERQDANKLQGRVISSGLPSSGDRLEWNGVEWSGMVSAPKAHHLTHEASGSDVVSVSGLSGVLATRQDADKIYGVSVSGLLPTSGQMLSYDGVKWLPTAPMELGQFFPAFCNANVGNFNVRTVGTSSNGQFNFQVPKNFDSLISLHIVGLPGANAAGASKDIDISSQYGKEGEQYNNHTASDTSTLYTIPAGGTVWYLDISTIFTGLEAGDSGGLNVQHNGIGTNGVNYLGIVMRYRPKRL